MVDEAGRTREIACRSLGQRDRRAVDGVDVAVAVTAAGDAAAGTARRAVFGALACGEARLGGAGKGLRRHRCWGGGGGAAGLAQDEQVRG